MSIKRILYVWSVVFFLLPHIVLASGNMMWPLQGEITSDYGYRVSPGGVGSTNHRGIDIGGEYGQPVIAAADGVVTYASWGDGYGYYVEIDHGDGVTTGYGHNQEIAVDVGQQVQRGETVAFCGSTGYSTGPHVHFEVCVFGEPQPPYEYLGIDYDGTGSGLPQDEDFIPVDFSVFYSFASSMGDMIGLVGAACTSGLRIMQDVILWLFIALITMDLALAFMWSMFNSDEVEGIFPFLLKKLTVYGILMFGIQQWGVVLDAVRNYFVSSAALMFSTDVGSAVAAVSDPTNVIQKGMQLTAPYFNYISSFTNPVSVMLHQAVILVVFLLGVLIVAIFLLMGLQIMLAYMEFYIMGLFSVISVSLGGFKHTRNWPIAHMGIDGLISSGIKLMWFTFFALLLNLMLQGMPNSGLFIENAESGNIDTFIQAVGEIESGGDYSTPANEYGARGKYQILEENWPVWCEEAGLSPDAPWTQENQDIVARHKMQSYYDQYKSWRDVAIAWNAGGAWVGSDTLPAETADYLAKLEGKMNGVNTSFDIVAAVERFFFVLVLALIGNKVSGRILQTYCSGGGFRWSAG